MNPKDFEVFESFAYAIVIPKLVELGLSYEALLLGDEYGGGFVLILVLFILLVIVGIVRGNVPMNPASIAMALLIGGGFWFLVAWAVATAAVDVETDIAESQKPTADDSTA